MSRGRRVLNSQGDGGRDQRPYFFLSYAHIPRAGNRGSGDPNIWVAQLYNDLCEAIFQLTDAPSGHPVGFMDRSMHQGQKWAERLSAELANCRVFVPLYSPRYFASQACGKEWHLFSQRPVYQRRQSGERHTGIVPVLWVAMNHYPLPRVASELQFSHESFGGDYAAEGLYALMKIASYRAQYQNAVYRLAERIVYVAKQTVIPLGQQADFESQPSAFEPPLPTDRVRISVYSLRRRELPAGRGSDCYGARRLDWQPYQPHSARPLAEDAAEVARRMGFEPTVAEFEEDADRMLAEEPTGPSVLLVDRWALTDRQRSGKIRQLDRKNLPWVSVLEPWNPEDPECRRDEEMLNGLSEEVLRLSRGAHRPTLRSQPAGTPGTLEEFRGELERAVMQATNGFEQRGEARPVGTGPRKPSLRQGLRGAEPPAGPPTDGYGSDDDGGLGRAARGGGES
ncbi:TIR-like protein FxsC [Kitasatospora sp. NPDC049258]|uniref:TIR-like protein FxsC n=1 Tax=Kitasatospora sp. NPDC049258 TaxID=3155394 RepID=UPI0034483228